MVVFHHFWRFFQKTVKMGGFHHFLLVKTAHAVQRMLRLNPGNLLKVNFNNNLVEQATRVVDHNSFQLPDTSNLHFHGPFISGELPSDDVTMGIPAGDSYQYQTVFPEEHMPGTFWIHPHYHGSTTLQVSGGTAAALIVNDPVGFLPSQVENAEEYREVFKNIN